MHYMSIGVADVMQAGITSQYAHHAFRHLLSSAYPGWLACLIDQDRPAPSLFSGHYLNLARGLAANWRVWLTQGLDQASGKGPTS
jgi:hypothetical protein